MDKFKKQSRPLTTLHDFAKNNNDKISKKPQNSHLSSKKLEQSNFGLSTLLHFNNNFTLSSIRSKIGSSRMSLQSPQFSAEAKLDIEELKSRRLELQKKWGNKQIKHGSIKSKIQSLEIDQEQYIQNFLDESQVQAYSQSLQKTKYVKNQIRLLVQERFILDLKNQIKADKAKQFILKIKRIVLKDFILNLSKYLELKEFRQKCKSNLLKVIIQEWKQLADKSAERQQLRRTIVQKIKTRKIFREFNIQPKFDNFQF